MIYWPLLLLLTNLLLVWTYTPTRPQRGSVIATTGFLEGAKALGPGDL
jgi:hypothetical protein